MKKNSLRTVFIWSLIVALGGFLFGFDTAVISGVEKQIQELFSLSSFMHGFTIASALIGTVTGALIAGRPADRFGSRGNIGFGNFIAYYSDIIRSFKRSNWNCQDV